MSYTDNGDGSITDNVTGLMWQKGENTSSGSGYNWYQASGTYDPTYNPSSQNVCGSLGLGGYSDWRLPTKKELITLVDYNSIPDPNRAINKTYFPDAYTKYWSDTTSISKINDAWSVDFDFGSVSAYGKSQGHYVRCVRGDQSFPSLTDNGNGTVTDNGTGLMWQQGEPGAKTWDNALSYCEGLSLGGQSDWRLPNIKELESITDDETYSPVINTTYFPQSKVDGYTTNAHSTDYAWGVYFRNGYVDNGYKSSSAHVRCVRGGQSGSVCGLTISPSSRTFTSSADTATVTVTTSAGSCTWSASSTLDWVTISPTSGTGSGTVAISVSANTTGAARTGNIDIAGQTFMITQTAAPSCTYSISPTSKTFTSKKGNVTVNVTATGDNCTLNPSETHDWITASQSGSFTQNKNTKKWSGKVKIDVTENKTSSTRTGTVDIGGQTFTVTQSGASCTLKISPETTKTSLAGAGGTGSFTVTAPDGCNWTAESTNTEWLTITSGTSGTGSGTVNYTASANTGKKRTGKINVATSDKKSKKVFTAVQNKK